MGSLHAPTGFSPSWLKSILNRWIKYEALYQPKAKKKKRNHMKPTNLLRREMPSKQHTLNLSRHLPKIHHFKSPSGTGKSAYYHPVSETVHFKITFFYQALKQFYNPITRAL